MRLPRVNTRVVILPEMGEFKRRILIGRSPFIETENNAQRTTDATKHAGEQIIWLTGKRHVCSGAAQSP